MKSAFDVQHPFFLPLWRRVATVAACIGWAIVELVGGNVFWAIMFAAPGAWCAHQFFIAFDEEAIRKKLNDEEETS